MGGDDPWLWDPDAHQRLIYERAGLDPDEPAMMMDLAVGLGLRVQLAAHGGLKGDAELAHDGQGWVIRRRPRLPLERAKFAVAHEIAEWFLSDIIDGGIELACNALAAALIAPRRPFQSLIRLHGEADYEQLALPFTMTETSAALRVAELREQRLIVVTPHRVYARGDWNTDEWTMRGWVQQDLPGLRKARLRDDPRRMVLTVEDAG